jgi:hypothetical protein
MPTAITSGGKRLSIDNQQKEKIIKWKEKFGKDKLVDISGNFIEVGRIKEIIDDRDKFSEEKSKEYFEKIKKINLEHKEDRDNFSKLGVKEKVIKTLDNICYLAWKSRGNGRKDYVNIGNLKSSYDLPNFKKTKEYMEIAKVLIEYFKENPKTKYYPPRETYIDLIPDNSSSMYQMQQVGDRIKEEIGANN